MPENLLGKGRLYWPLSARWPRQARSQVEREERGEYADWMCDLPCHRSDTGWSSKGPTRCNTRRTVSRRVRWAAWRDK